MAAVAVSKEAKSDDRQRTVDSESSLCNATPADGQVPIVPQRTEGNSVVAPPAQPPALFLNDIAQWAARRKVGVPLCDEHVVGPLNKIGIAVHTFEGLTNPHAFSAACREAAVVSVIGKSGRGMQNMRVWDVFGSARSHLINPKNSAPFGKTLVDGVPKSSRTMEISWFSGPDTAIAGDASRGQCVRTGDFHPPYDVVVCVDIYQSGNSSSQEFSPEFMKELILASKTGVVYWIGRFFPGQAGADEPIVDKDGKAIIEQVYVKNSEGFVLSSPDESSGCYAPHPWPEWLCQRSHKGLDISPVSKVGPYHVVRVAMTAKGAIALQPMPVPSGGVMSQVLDTTKWCFGYFPVYSTQEVSFVVEVFLKVGPRFVRKIPNGQTMDMAQVMVEKEFSLMPWLSALRTRFPEYYQSIFTGTVLACVYAGRWKDTAILGNLRKAHVVPEAHLVATRRADNGMTRPWNLGSLTAIAAVSASILFWTTRAAAWIVPSKPLLSAFLEEGLAWASEPVAIAGVIYEATTTGKGENPLPRVFLHGACYALRKHGVFGRLAALVLHLGWNWCSGRVGKRYAVFRSEFEQGRLVESVKGCVECIPEHSTLPSYTANVTDGPEHFRGEIRIFVDQNEVTIRDAFFALGRPVGRNVMFPILITQRLLQQPANNETNLLAAALFRVHNDPFWDSKFDEEFRHGNWDILGKIFVSSFITGGRCAVYSVSDNILAMGVKGRRIREAYDADMAGHTLFMKKTINLKWNETISACKEVNGILTMKPRAIQNLPAIVHARMGGFARSFNKELHERFDGRVWSIGGFPVRVFFASGYTQEKLSEIGRAAASGDAVFAMSGDDSFVAWGVIPSKSFGGEADQSQFDHTQDDGPMKIFMRQILVALGFPDDFIDMAYGACRSGYTIRKGRLAVIGNGGTQMPTGITTTTSFNSLDTFAMFVWFMHNRSRFDTLADAGAELGFKVKFFPRESIQTSTFLKGWWQNGSGGLQWVPLPSACLKIGKLLSDPVIITRTIRKGKKHFLSPRDAIRMCATALAQSYGNVDPSYPILGEFLRTMSRLGKQPRIVLQSLHESWKPVMTGIQIDREEACNSMLIRYGIDREEVEDVERLLRSVVSLPSYIEHPVFDKLCNVDY